MWEEGQENTQPLKTGLTTGSCATACCVAAAHGLLNKIKSPVVSITLPKGKMVEMTILEYQEFDDALYASTVKDAGDDPDITHGAIVFIKLKLTKTLGIVFMAGEGVGTVTRAGLELAIGEPAINPVPRKMMEDHLGEIAQQFNYHGGFIVTVGVVNGESIALKTMNVRLGIIKGLSILGTTGIVRPFSCSAWIASIYQGIDVALANGVKHIAASTGNTSEDAIKNYYGLPVIALIEMGDFAGAVLKHLKQSPVEKLSICGGFGKITKLANGHLDLNSRFSKIDFKHMSEVAVKAGASQLLSECIVQANTSIEVLNQCRDENINIANAMCSLALEKAKSIVPDKTVVEILAVDRKGNFIGYAGVKNFDVH